MTGPRGSGVQVVLRLFVFLALSLSTSTALAANGSRTRTPSGPYFLDTSLHLGMLYSRPTLQRIDALPQVSIGSIGFGRRIGDDWLIRAELGSLLGVLFPHLEVGLSLERQFLATNRAGLSLRTGIRGLSGLGYVCANRNAACEADARAVNDARVHADAIFETSGGDGFAGELGIAAEYVFTRGFRGFGFMTYQAGYARRSIIFPFSSSILSGFSHGFLASVGVRWFLFG
jgi:hypothetical protein